MRLGVLGEKRCLGACGLPRPRWEGCGEGSLHLASRLLGALSGIRFGYWSVVLSMITFIPGASGFCVFILMVCACLLTFPAKKPLAWIEIPQAACLAFPSGGAVLVAGGFQVPLSGDG